MCPQQVTMWCYQENMHVHYSNTVINILRITETHKYTNMLSANYGVNYLGSFQMPLRSRTTSSTRTDLTYYGCILVVVLFLVVIVLVVLNF
jgi:hypothetical protein